MKNNLILVGITALVVGGAVGFFAGMKYQQSQRGNFTRQFNDQNGPRGTSGAFGQGGRANFRPVAGEIISIDEKSLTVKLTDGSSKIILLSQTTKINKATEVTIADLTKGAQVAVFGTENTDGSVLAANIQLNPQVLGAENNSNQKSADAREIVVSGSNYKFAPDKISVKKGEKVRILFKNAEGVHDFKVDELNIATPTIRSNQEDWVEFMAVKTGSFEFYCSIGQHRAMGMKGILVVE